MARLDIIKTELDTDPLVRGYSGMSDAAAATDLNLLLYDAPADQSALLDYLLTNEHRGESLYGRILYVATSRVGDLAPMDDAEAGIAMTINHIAGANTILRYADPALPPITPLSNVGFDNALNAIAGGGANAQCLGPAHKSAIQALSQNQLSRAAVIEAVGPGGTVEEEDVRNARTLP